MSDILDYLLYVFLTLAIVGLLTLMGAIGYGLYSDYHWAKSCVGRGYQAIVVDIGIPTERETFPDGTEVLCWRKFYEAQIVLVSNGKTSVPVYQPAYVSGWKAVIRNGRCVSMEAL